jgi:plastocyanin
MSIRRRLGFLLAAVLGAAAVVLPAIAASETGQTIEATNKPGEGIYKEETHAWSPPQVTITPDATVTLSNPTEVRHGVEWVSAPATPTCTGGVPVGSTEAASNTKWSGACTFTTPGVYVFYCTVHHGAMTGRVTVTANGTTTTATTTPTNTTTTTAPTTPGESPTSATATPGSPLVGSAANAIKLPFAQRGKSVRGSVAVSPAGAAGRLEVDLLARRASLASAGHPPPAVRVGRIVHASLRAGKVPFSVSLTARARNALSRRGRLALSVKVVIEPVSGPTVTITRAVVVRP